MYAYYMLSVQISCVTIDIFIGSRLKNVFFFFFLIVFFFQAEDGIRDLVRSRGLGDVYKRQA